jgi:hypothetical protein
MSSLSLLPAGSISGLQEWSTPNPTTFHHYIQLNLYSLVFLMLALTSCSVAYLCRLSKYMTVCSQNFNHWFKTTVKWLLIALVIGLDCFAIILQIVGLYLLAQLLWLAQRRLADLATFGIMAFMIIGIFVCVAFTYLENGL